MKKIAYITPLLLFFALMLLASGGKLVPAIGNANGTDTSLFHGSVYLGKAFMINDTFANKSGYFVLIQRDSANLVWIDSAGRTFTPDMIVGGSSYAGYNLDVTGKGRVNGILFEANGSQTKSIKGTFATDILLEGQIASNNAHIRFRAVDSAGRPALMFHSYLQGITDKTIMFKEGDIFCEDLTATGTIAINNLVTNTIKHEVVGGADLAETWRRPGSADLGVFGFPAGSNDFQFKMSTSTTTFSGGTLVYEIDRSTNFFGFRTSTPTAQLDINGTTGYNQFRLRTSYTPTGTADTNGNVGDVSWDDNYWYVKTSAGWKRSALSTF